MNTERIQQIYDELAKYEIALDRDPQARGPKYLQGLIAECRNHLNSVSRIQLEVHRVRQDRDRTLRALETVFDVDFAGLLANDERIRRLPNIEDRRATARVFLRESVAEIERLKAEIRDIDYVEKAIRHRHKELSSTMSEIKLQKALIMAEIGTGAMYGDERIHSPGDSSSSSRGPLGVSIDEDELEALFDEETAKQKAEEAQQTVEGTQTVEAAVEAPQTVEPTPAPVVVGESKKPEPEAKKVETKNGKPTEDDVSAFLGVSMDQDFEDVLSDI